MFVGDSLSRNQWQSLTCLLYTAVPNAKYTVTTLNYVSTFTFTSHVLVARRIFFLHPNSAAAAASTKPITSVAQRIRIAATTRFDHELNRFALSKASKTLSSDRGLVDNQISPPSHAFDLAVTRAPHTHHRLSSFVVAHHRSSLAHHQYSPSVADHHRPELGIGLGETSVV
ncbi:hypothetical protein U1Q18_000816 [Sarracenia purpurea var. burkii]